MENLTIEDCKYYLQIGDLTRPFLKSDFVEKQVFCDFNHKVAVNKDASLLNSLINWINHNIHFSNEDSIQKLKFSRTSKEIWESGYASGCTDFALLFCTFARQLNIPTTLLHTAEYNWLQNFLHNEYQEVHYGHSFCECFYNNKWILIDPTCKKITTEYNIAEIELSYIIDGNIKFIPYFRGLDLEHKQTTKEHNEKMDKFCKNL